MLRPLPPHPCFLSCLDGRWIDCLVWRINLCRNRIKVTGDGGYYKVFSYAYHPSIAFAINCIILVSNAASGAAVALVGSEYITGVILPGEKDLNYIQNVHTVIALAAIVIFYGVNMIGLRLSAKTQTILTIIKISLILLLITPLFFAINENPSASLPGSVIDPGFREYIKAFGIGLVAVSFTYGGYQQTINFGAEVNKPQSQYSERDFHGYLYHHYIISHHQLCLCPCDRF